MPVESSGNNVNITAATGISTAGNTTAAGTLTLDTASLTNNNTLTGNAIVVTSPVAQGLTILGTGTFTATTSSTLTATANSLTFGNGTLGSQTFNGTANFNAAGPSQSVVVNNLYTVTGNSAVNLNTSVYTQIGSGVIIGNPLNFNSASGAGTIANSSGDVNLSSGLIFHGLSLAILAYGNITAAGPVIIDLSGQSASVNGGNGGTLSILAGVNLSPSTGGQIGPTDTIFTVSSVPSASGGSVSMSNVTINTNSSIGGAVGGNVLVVANNGAFNSGSITLGSITTASSGTPTASGGSVQIIGPGGVNVGAITTAANVPGLVSISSGTPVLSGPITDKNGTLTGGSFTAGSLGGDILLTNINAGPTGTVIIQTGGAGTISQSTAGTVSTNQLIMTAGSGGIGVAGVGLQNISTNASLLTANAGTTGDVLINDSAALATLQPATVNLITYHNSGNNFSLTMTPPSGSSSITIAAGETITGNSSVTMTSAGPGGGILLSNGAQITTLSGSSSVALTATGTGNIDATDNTSSINTVGLTLVAAGTGSIGPTHNINTTATSLTAQARGSANSVVLVTDSASSAVELVDNDGFVNAAGSAGTFLLHTTLAGIAGNNGETAVNAGSVVLEAGAGSIGSGSGSNSVFVNTGAFTGRAQGAAGSSVFITDISSSAINLDDNSGIVNAAGAAGTYLVEAAHGFNNNQSQTAIAADSVVLVAEQGSIGTGSGIGSVNVNATNVTAQAVGGSGTNVFITSVNGAAINLSDYSDAHNTFTNAAGATSGTYSANAAHGFTSNFGQTAVAANSVILTAANGSVGSGAGNSSLFVNTANLTANANGGVGSSVFLNDLAAAVTLGNSSGASFTLTAGGSVSTPGTGIAVSASAAGTLTIDTNSLTVPATDVLQGGTVMIAGKTIDGSGVTAMSINNGGTIKATGVASNLTITGALGQELDITGGGTLAAQNGQTINLLAPNDVGNSVSPSLVFNGNQTFTFLGGGQSGTVNLLSFPNTNMSQSIVINTPATLTFNMNNSTINLNACNVVFNGALNLNPGSFSGNTLFLNCPNGAGTIAQSNGSPLDLNSGALPALFASSALQGLSLTILSANNIIDTAGSTTINLSNGFGSGGTLTLIAGYSFSPLTSGILPTGPNNTFYTLGSPTAGGSIDLGNVTINTFGSGSGGGVLAIANGSITLGAIDAHGGSGTGGSINIIGSGGVTIGGLINTSADNVNSAGTVSISSGTPQANGTVLIASGVVISGSFSAVAPFSGNIALSGTNAFASTVTLTTGGSGFVQSSATISASTLNIVAGSGGITNNSGGNLLTEAGTIGARSTGQVLIDNTGSLIPLTLNQSSGTTFTLATGNSITLNSSGSGLKATAISLTAAGNVNLDNNIAGASGDAASVNINAGVGNGDIVEGLIGVGNPYTISTASLTLHAGTGSIGGTTPITTDAATLTANTTTPGSVTVVDSAASVTLSGTNSGSNYTLSMTNNGNITAGTITANQGAISLTTGGNITVTGGTTSHILDLLATGAASVLNLPTGTTTLGPTSTTIIVQRDGATDDGAVIDIQANQFKVNGTLSNTLTLDASGTGAGSGGTAEVQFNSNSTAETVGNSGFILNAPSGLSGGGGGTTIFITQGALTANPSGSNLSVNAVNGNGGTITLTAGGSLLVTGALSANAATNTATSFAGGEVELNSNSSVVFNIGSVAASNTNGIKAALSVSGVDGGANGTIDISNAGGGITDSTQALTSVGSLTFNTTGAPSATGTITVTKAIGNTNTSLIDLTAGNAGKVVVTGVALQTNTASSGTVQLRSGTGALNSITVDSAILTANTGGVVNVTDKNTSGVSLGSSSAGTTFTLTASSSITTTGIVGSGTALTLKTTGTNDSITLENSLTTSLSPSTITLTATGSGNIADALAGADSIQGGALTLTTTSGNIGSASLPLRISTSSVAPKTTGLVNLNNLSGGTLTLPGSTSKQAFTLTSAGNITVSAAIASATSVVLGTTGTAGIISINANVGSATLTNTINVTATGSGAIAGTGTLADNTYVALSNGTGNIGSAATALKVNTPTLAANTGGDGIVNVSNSLKTASTLGNSGAGGSFTFNAGGPLTVNGITTSQGSIQVFAASGLLQVVGGSHIDADSTTAGVLPIITLEAKSTTNGLITIGANSQIKSLSSISGDGGNVNIVIGAVPASPLNSYSSGGVPTPNNTTIDNPSQTFAGAQPAGIIGPSGLPAAVLNVIGAGVKLIFNTPSVTRTITLGSGVTITADPPAGAVSGASQLAASIQPNSIDASRLTSPASGTASDTTTQISETETGTVSPASISPMLLPPIGFNLNGITSQSQPLCANSAVAYGTATMNSTSFSVPSQSTVIGPVPSCSDNVDAAVWSDRELGLPVGSSTAADFQIAPGGAGARMTLRRGNVIVAPTIDAIVDTPFGQVRVGARSLVLIMFDRGGLSVFDFDDSHSNSVSVTVGSQQLSLSPGRHTTITNESIRQFELVNPAEAFAYRNITSAPVGGGFRAFISDFWVPLAVNNVVSVKHLVNAKHPEAIRVAGHLMKTTAILQQTRRADGYHLMPHPTVCAYLQ